MAVGFVASATSGSQASVSSFNIGTLGTGARAGIVFVATHGSAALDTGVTWNGVAMSLLYSATDTDTEPGAVRAYFLDNVTNGVITVSRTSSTVVTVGYAASISVTAGRRAEVFQTITRVSSTQNTNADTSTTGTGASGEVAVDDGSPGTSSMRFACHYTGAATPVAAGTNSTGLQLLDSTSFGSRFVRETVVGQGSRSVGFATGTTDDWALVAVAVRENFAIVSGSFTANAVILKTITPTFAANAVIRQTVTSSFKLGDSDPSFNGGAWIVKTYTFTDKKADAVIRRTMPIAGATLAANAVVKRTMPIAGASFAADSVRLKASGTLTLTANAVVKRTMPIAGAALTANAVVLKSSGTLTFSADAVIRKTFDFSFTADAVQLKSITVAGVTGETPGPPAYGTVDAVIAALLVVVEVTAPADAIKLRTFHFGSGVW